MDQNFKTFLKERNIPDETIKLLEEENIDTCVIYSMSDEQLSPFLPKYGDRIACFEFCKKRHAPASKRKKTLLDRLKKKIRKNKRNRSLSSSEEDEKSDTESPLVKTKRIIELGWLHKEREAAKYVQVRLKQGGGTRKLNILRTATKNDIIHEGQKTFFPDGSSLKGSLLEFDFDLMDFKECVIPEEYDINYMFQKSGLRTLRLYLATTRRSLENIPSVETFTSVSTVLQIPSSDVQSGTDFTSSGFEENTIFLDLDSSTLSHPYLTEELSEFINITQENTESNVSQEKLILKLHRGQIMKELIREFLKLEKNCQPFQIELILPNGEKERAENMGGVFRDLLSEFWTSFYDQCTVGIKSKIPCIRHDFGELEWKAVAKILWRGWKDENYFPVLLSTVFMQQCLFNSFDSDLLEDFWKFLSETDSNILKTAIEDISSIDESELQDVLQNLECKWLPTKENIKQLVRDIAHKELIQKPMYVIDSWSYELNGLLTSYELQDVMKMKMPTSKNILKLLNISSQSTLTSEMTETYGYLKKYIREANETLLRNFVRFTTGADIITQKSIDISFINNSNEFSRTPIAHTCASLLELPYNYKNFIEFRSEMNNLLSSNIWVMDVI